MKVQVPTSLDAITVAQYKHLRTLDDIQDPLEQLRKKITYLCGITESQLDQLTEESFTQLVNAISKIGANIKERYPLETFVDIDGVEYGFNPDLSRITLGEFADIEHLCQDGAEQNLESILSILYRPVTKKTGRLLPSSPLHRDRWKEVFRRTYYCCLWCIRFFFDYRKRVAAQFSQLFQGGGSTPVGKKWGWYSTIHSLAQGDILKVDEVTKVELSAALSYLSYEQDVNTSKRNNYGKSPK